MPGPPPRLTRASSDN
jgi:hypothetical protein